MKVHTEPKPHIAVVGSADLELSLPMDHLPTAGESLFAQPVSSRPGGRAADLCCALSSLDCRVFLFSCIGLDSHGSRILNDMRRHRVNVDFIERTEHRTGMILKMLDRDGRHSRVIAPGAGLRMTQKPLLAGKAMISACQLMILLADIPADVYTFAIQIAHHFSIPVIAAPYPIDRFNTSLLNQIDIIISSVKETEILTAAGPHKFDQADNALNRLLNKGVGAAVIYMDRLGSAASTEIRGASFYPAPKANTTAPHEAEDVFIAAFSYALSCNYSLGQACSFAGAAASLMQNQPAGAAKIFPTLKQTRDLISV